MKLFESAVKLATLRQLMQDDQIIPKNISDAEYIKWRKVLDKITDDLIQEVRQDVYICSVAIDMELKDWPSK